MGAAERPQPPRRPSDRSRPAELGAGGAATIKDLDSSSSSSDSEDPGKVTRWTVIAGSRTGLVVRRGADLKSPELSCRLRTGAVVEQMALVGERLHYRRLSGEGPDFGWVSLSYKGLRLVEKLARDAQVARREPDAWAMGMSARGRHARRQSPYRPPEPAAVISSSEVASTERTPASASSASPAPSRRLSSPRLVAAPDGGWNAVAGTGRVVAGAEQEDEAVDGAAPASSLDGEWDCVCDYKKNGGEVPLIMRIEGSVGRYRVAGACHRLFDIAMQREGASMVVSFRWANSNGQTGSGSWTLLQPQGPQGRRSRESQRLEGWWAQDGTHGTWSWSGGRRPLAAPPAFGPIAGGSGGAGAGLDPGPAQVAAGTAGAGATDAQSAVAAEAEGVDGGGEEATFEVVHERVAVRSRPSVDGEMLYALRKCTRVHGSLFQVSGVPWLRLAPEARAFRPQSDAWVLVDAARTKLGLGMLLRRVVRDDRPGRSEEAALSDLEIREIPLDKAERHLAALVEEAHTLARRCFGSASSALLMRGGAAEAGRLAVALTPGMQRRSVAGYCFFRVDQDSAAFSLDELLVAEELRHRGVGAQLVQWAVDTAHEEHCQVLSVVCPEDAVPFFVKEGLAPSQERQEACAEGTRRLEMAPSHGASLRHFERLAAGTTEPRQAAGGSALVECPACLVCFLASHVANEERLERFADLLGSVAAQEPHGPPALFVSWSAGSPQLRNRARTLLRGATAEIPALRAGEQEAPLSQFQHFASCVGLATGALGNDGWVFFSDDDDLWHPRRYAEFLGAIAHVRTHSETVTVIGKGHAILCRESKTRPTSPVDVERLLEAGVVRLSGTQSLGFQGQGTGAAGEEVELGSGPGPEYFDIAIRAPQLRTFMRTTPKRILANRFCDRHFLHRFYVPYEGRAHYFNPIGWLYFYSRLGAFSRAEAGDYAGGASFGVAVGDADRRLATSCADNADCDLSVEDLSFLVAVLRSSVEEMLISKAAVRERAIPKDVVENVCRRAARRYGNFAGAEAGAGGEGFTLDLAREVGAEVCAALGLCA